MEILLTMLYILAWVAAIVSAILAGLSIHAAGVESKLDPSLKALRDQYRGYSVTYNPEKWLLFFAVSVVFIVSYHITA